MEFGFFIIRFTASLIKWISLPFRQLADRKKDAKPIPAIDDPLLTYSATKLAEMIRDRKVKSATVIQAFIKRIKNVNPIINAVVEDRFTEAIAEAEEVDNFLSKTDLSSEELTANTPLLGVPVTIKESCSVKGVSLAVGFTFLKGTKATEDGAAVKKLKTAGAIPLLVSTTPELCLSFECNNLITGKTRNPYNTNHTSGGSSGGEGALIGSGSSIIGIGSDLAGSVRLPAMFQCIFGHKPTAKLVPTEGHYPTSEDEYFLDYLTIGPLVRYAEDLKLMMQVLSQSDKVDFKQKMDLRNLNLYFMEDIGFYVGVPAVEGEIKERMKLAVEYLSKHFDMNVKDKKFNELKTIADSSFVSLMDIDDKVKIFKDPLNPEDKHTTFEQLWKSVFSKPDVFPFTVLANILDKANIFIPRSHNERHHQRMQHLQQELADTLGTNGVFLFPTFPTSAFKHNEIMWNMVNSGSFTLPFNIMGLPSTQVPLGFDSKGLPVGIQVVAGPYQDHLSIAVAEALEKPFGGWQPPFKV